MATPAKPARPPAKQGEAAEERRRDGGRGGI